MKCISKSFPLYKFVNLRNIFEEKFVLKLRNSEIIWLTLQYTNVYNFPIICSSYFI